MKKPTFRSASATRRTSSRSGASGRTAGTARTRAKKPAANGTYVGAVKKINKMSSTEFRHTLQRLGITKANGELTGRYAQKK